MWIFHSDVEKGVINRDIIISGKFKAEKDTK
jgi:hypothetical protein